MGDIRVLLRDAVPVDEAEPDLGAVAQRVRRRRRRRVASRLGAVAVTVGLIGGAAGLSALDRDGGDDVATAPADRGHDDPERRPTWAETTDAEVFAWQLARRGWLAEADVEWPELPSEFLAGEPEPGIIVVGTLTEVRPGPVTSAPSGPLWECNTPRCLPPTSVTNVETVVRVEQTLPGDAAGPGEVVVPWITDVGDVDQATSDELAAPFEEVAPIGARVLVYLRPNDGGTYEWQPDGPSGIVIEDGDGVVVPQPDDDAVRLAWSFDDYLAELDRVFTDRLFPDD
jgi:hypothetical protein